MRKTFLLGVVSACALGWGQAASAAPALSFLIDGDTFLDPFSIENTSTAGESIVFFQIDLSPVPLYFDTSDADFTSPRPFEPQGGSDVTTGMVNPVNVPDQSQVLSVSFTDFNAGETFAWRIDIDQTPTGDESVWGDDMIDALIRIDFSNGQTILGALEAVAGNDDAAQFVSRITIPTPPPGSTIPTPAAAGMGIAMLAAAALRRRRD